jgi:hypothetical protein
LIRAASIRQARRQGLPDPGTDANKELKAFCDSAADIRKYLPPLTAITLYPGSSATVGYFGLNGNPQLFDKAGLVHGYSGNFLILLCVTYKFATGKDFHQTGQAYAVFKPNTAINIDGETVPPDGLV